MEMVCFFGFVIVVILLLLIRLCFVVFSVVGLWCGFRCGDVDRVWVCCVRLVFVVGCEVVV